MRAELAAPRLAAPGAGSGQLELALPCGAGGRHLETGALTSRVLARAGQSAEARPVCWWPAAWRVAASRLQRAAWCWRS